MKELEPTSPYAGQYFGGKSPQPIVWLPMAHMQEFLENLEANGVSDGYMRVVRVGLAHFALFARTEGLRHPDEIERKHILRFQMYLNEFTKPNGKPLSIAYRQQLLKYLRSWINWLVVCRYIQQNPWVHIRVGVTVKKPKPLEGEELAQLFATHNAQAFSLPPFFFHRRETILSCLFAWGLRVHELQSLTVASVDMRQEFVVVRNKSRRDAPNKTKPAAYTDEMKQVIGRWLSHRSRHAVPHDDSLLIDQSGKCLSLQMIRKIIVELGERANVPVNPHRLRDTFATEMLDADVPVEQIMKMLGHTNRSQTLAYARVNDPKLAQSHDRVMTPLLNKLLGGDI